jgi:hypothetical protein
LLRIAQDRDRQRPAPNDLYLDETQGEALRAWVLTKIAWAEAEVGPRKPLKTLVSGICNYVQPQFGWLAFGMIGWKSNKERRMDHEQKHQAILEGQRVLEAARQAKRVVPNNGTGRRWRASWPTLASRWTEPSQEDFGRQPAAHRCPTCGHVSSYVWDGLARRWRATHSDPCKECSRRSFVERAMEEAKAATLHRYGLDMGRYAHMTLDTYWPGPGYPSQPAAPEAVGVMVATRASGDWSAGILLASPVVDMEYLVGLSVSPQPKD